MSSSPTGTAAAPSTDAVEIRVSRRGSGPPTIVLPGIFGIDGRSEAFDALADASTVIVTTHPGFGDSPRPAWCDSIDDLVLAYLDLVEREELTDVTLVGCCIGGWIAAEIAVLRPAWLSRLILVDSLGLRAGGTEDRDFADIFAMTLAEIRALAFVDQGLAETHLGTEGRPVEEVLEIARNQEATAVYGWQPYLHNPKLHRRLGRVRVPTLVVWGERDGIAQPRVGRALAEAIPGARFASIPGAGHLPHLEQPSAFTRLVRDFSGRVEPRD